MSGDDKLRRLREFIAAKREDHIAAARSSFSNASAVIAEECDRFLWKADALLAEPHQPVPAAEAAVPAAAGDARINGVDGDETLRHWLRTKHNPLGSDLEGVVAELLRRALKEPKL